ncbi:hypothetical protein ISS30_08515 [bacterium]|nr:hypothetical protein [bacterium]
MSFIWSLNLFLGKVFDFIISPFAGLSPFWGLAFISLITGAVMVMIFKYISNQAGIRRTKARIRAYLFEIWLYKHEFSSFIGSIGRIFTANLSYMKYAVSPMLVMIIPVVLIMVHLNLNYSFRPLKIGETPLMTVKFTDAKVLQDTTLKAEASGGVNIDGAPVRAMRKNEVTWRIIAVNPGRHQITIKWENGEVSKRIDIGPGKVQRLSPKKSLESSILDAFGNPGEKPIPKNTGVEWITLDYPARDLKVLGIKIHWIIVFFVLSVAAGFGLKGVFKVEI